MDELIKNYLNFKDSNNAIKILKKLQNDRNYTLALLLVEIFYKEFKNSFDIKDEYATILYYNGIFEKSYEIYNEILNNIILSKEKCEHYLFNQHFSIKHILNNKINCNLDKKIFNFNGEVSIIIYNANYNIEKCVNSVINCFDLENVKEWFCITNKNNKYSFIKNFEYKNNLAFTLNNILKEIHTEYILFIEDDNIFFNDNMKYIKKSLEIFEENKDIKQIIFNNYYNNNYDKYFLKGEFNYTKNFYRYFIHKFDNNFDDNDINKSWPHFSLNSPTIFKKDIFDIVGKFDIYTDNFLIDFGFNYMKYFKSAFFESIYSYSIIDKKNILSKEVFFKYLYNTQITENIFVNNNLDYNEIKDVSIVTVTMNRHNNLITTLHNWINLPVKEIIIIDWCSDIYFEKIIPTYFKEDNNFKKIKIYRVNGYEKWILTWAFNLGFSLATSKYILKLDSDILVDKDFFIKNRINENIFFRGFWNKSHNKHLNGQFFCKKDHLKQIGYYNEYIITYGYDDCDLYKRLCNLGLEENLIKCLDHLDCDDYYRIKYQNVANIKCEINYNRLKCEKKLLKYDGKRFKKIDNFKYEILPFDEEYFFDKECYENAYKYLENIVPKNIFDKEKFIVLKVKNGICNRLRALLSTILFAEDHDYKLYVIWEITQGYDESEFHDIFKLNYKLDFIKSNDIKDIKFDFIFTDYIYTKKSIDNILKNNKIYIESSDFINNLFKIDKPYYSFQNFIEPSLKIKIILKYIFNKYNFTKYNIFHIRRGDAIKTDYKENYIKSSIYKFAKYINESDCENIVITDDYEYCDNFLSILCQNNYKIINRNSINKNKNFNETKDVIFIDAIDMFLMMKANKIYSTNWSSFSAVASMIFKKENITVLDNNKFGLLVYKKSNNIGDYIQSIAIKQYLPFINKYIDRDDMHDYNDDNINLIMAGWFMHSKDCTSEYIKNNKMCVCDINDNINWPPSKKINPLFISFNLSNNNLLKFKEYFQENSPIGCRDIETMNKIKNIGIETYLSYCGTLTLKKDNIEQKNIIYVVDVSEDIIDKYLTDEYKNDSKIIYGKNCFNNKILQSLSEDEKFKIAENNLKNIQESKLVITSRLHIMAPCLSYGIPVIFVGIENTKNKNLIDNPSYSPTRYNEIKDLIDNEEKLKEVQKEFEKNIITNIYNKFYM